MIIKLRGHHLLCTPRFIGKGYSEDFVKRMGELVTRLDLPNYKDEEIIRNLSNNMDEEDKFMIICGSDYACEKCPNKIGEDQCELSTTDVLNKDKKAIQAAGLIENEVYSIDEIKKAISKITKKDFLEICSGCRWFDICK